MTHDALKILWRQCSEFACANIVSSTSVGLRPRPREVRRRGSRSRPAPARGRTRRWPPRSRRGRAPSTSIVVSGFGGDVAEQRVGLVERRRAPSRSCDRAAAAGSRRQVARRRRGGTPCRARCAARASRPQWRAMSVAFDDHGEMVPRRGVTRTARARRLGRRRRPVGQQALEVGALAGRQVARRLDEVPEARGGHAQGAVRDSTARLSLSRRNAESARPPRRFRRDIREEFLDLGPPLPAGAGDAAEALTA